LLLLDIYNRTGCGACYLLSTIPCVSGIWPPLTHLFCCSVRAVLQPLHLPEDLLDKFLEPCDISRVHLYILVITLLGPQWRHWIERCCVQCPSSRNVHNIILHALEARHSTLSTSTFLTACILPSPALYAVASLQSLCQSAGTSIDGNTSDQPGEAGRDLSFIQCILCKCQRATDVSDRIAGLGKQAGLAMPMDPTWHFMQFASPPPFSLMWSQGLQAQLTSYTAYAALCLWHPL